MASLDLGALKIKIELDNKEANKGLKDTQTAVEEVDKKGSNRLKNFGKAAAASFAAVGTAAIATGKKLWEVANNTASYADSIDKASQRVGMSKEAYQEWQYILGQNGVEVASLETAMKSFGNVIDGSSKAGTQALEKLGISIEGLSQEDAWEATVKALQGVENETERLSLATDLYGARAAQSMMPMLNQTIEGTEQLRQRAHDLGIVLSDDAVNAGVVFGDTLSDLQQAIGAVWNIIGSALLPVLTEMIDIVIAQMPTISSLVESLTPAITEMFESLVPTIEQLVSELLPVIIELVMSLVPLITEMFAELLPPLLEVIKQLLPPLSEILNSILPIIISLIQMLTPLLLPIIELLTPILELAIAIITPLVEIISSILPPIIDLLNALIKPILIPLTEAFSAVANVITNVFKVAFEALQPVIENFQGLLSGVIEFITGVFTGNWGKAWEGVKNVFSNIINGLGNIFKAPINYIIKGINTFIRGLNKIQIPNWVPLIGGKGFNIGEIPLLAKGGNITMSGAAVVGEAGPEIINLPKGASVSPLKETGNKTITQNNYFTQKELSPYQTQLEIKRLSRNLAGAF